MGVAASASPSTHGSLESPSIGLTVVAFYRCSVLASQVPPLGHPPLSPNIHTWVFQESCPPSRAPGLGKEGPV